MNSTELNKKADILVIGSGVAGLTYAILCAEKFKDKSILVLAKQPEKHSNSFHAQGGIAISGLSRINDPDSHIQDTIIAGCSLNNSAVVDQVIREAPKILSMLENWGVSFDKDINENYLLGLEGGHSKNRILHHKDFTGQELIQTLLNKSKTLSNIKIRTDIFAVDLIIGKGEKEQVVCKGVYALDQTNSQIINIHSSCTLIAAGGIGAAYKLTTNPKGATGDGIAMAHRANAKITNMEFVQFHPTAFFEPDKRPLFLITEALRGYGAILRNHKGLAFMEKYDNRKDLAPRDIVSKAITNELIIESVEFEYLDCTMLNQNELEAKFPSIINHCKSKGLNLAADFIPITPAAHYICGGIETDLNGRTSIASLLACGECADTGLHGANRLASNSLLEAFVFAFRCFNDTYNVLNNITEKDILIPDRTFNIKQRPIENQVINEIRTKVQNTMTECVGIIRHSNKLREALVELNNQYKNVEMLVKQHQNNVALLELLNIIEVSRIIVNHSIARKTSVGVFNIID